MSKKVADVLWEMLAKAGVKRCYGIVGDALNPVVDALRRNGAIELVPVPKLHPEYVSLKNAFLLPHIGSATIETRTAMGILALDNVEAVLNGGPAPTLIPGRSRESSEPHLGGKQ
jgi:lactate dehydrogenase-like 2-hydroxyacid dehydrogenase